MRAGVAVLRGHHRLGRFLADLLQDRVVALGEQRRDVGRRGIRAAARRDRRRQRARGRRRCVSHRRRSPSDPSARARHHAMRRRRACGRSSARGPCGTRCRLPARPQHDRVAVAIEPDLAHALHVAGGLALAPQLVARARPVVRLARVARCARAPRGSSTRASAPCATSRPARSPARGRRRSSGHSSSQVGHSCAHQCCSRRTSMPGRRHRRLRLADRELAVVEDRRGEHGVGAAFLDAVDQVLQRARRRRTR